MPLFILYQLLLLLHFSLSPDPTSKAVDKYYILYYFYYYNISTLLYLEYRIPNNPIYFYFFCLLTYINRSVVLLAKVLVEICNIRRVTGVEYGIIKNFHYYISRFV